jgi:hypothetical protein
VANRALLHRSKINDFKEWLRQDGWMLEAPKGTYEILRARKKGKPPLIIYTRISETSEHITVPDRNHGVVKAYLKARRDKRGVMANEL